MAELKTKPTDESVEKYLKGITDPVKRQEKTYQTGVQERNQKAKQLMH